MAALLYFLMAVLNQSYQDAMGIPLSHALRVLAVHQEAMSPATKNNTIKVH